MFYSLSLGQDEVEKIISGAGNQKLEWEHITSYRFFLYYLLSIKLFLTRAQF